MTWRSEEKHTITRAACDENPICHAELRSFIGYESFRRPSAPQQRWTPTQERELRDSVTLTITARLLVLWTWRHDRNASVYLTFTFDCFLAKQQQVKQTTATSIMQHFIITKNIPDRRIQRINKKNASGAEYPLVAISSEHSLQHSAGKNVKLKQWPWENKHGGHYMFCLNFTEGLIISWSLQIKCRSCKLLLVVRPFCFSFKLKLKKICWCFVTWNCFYFSSNRIFMSLQIITANR